jgi:hypothetical protein
MRREKGTETQGTLEGEFLSLAWEDFSYVSILQEII